MIITRTPLRVSFAGGGTDMADYYTVHGGGAVVSSAINKYIYITVNPKFDNKIRISYSKTEIVDTVDELNHEIARAALKMAGIKGGIEITSIADIPAGTGLGSSSTFTVGLLNALFTYAGRVLSPAEMAERACQIEIDILGHPIGKQDQYAAAFGGMNHFAFNPDGTVTRTQIVLSDSDRRTMSRKLMFFYTGITRSADNILSEQKANISDKATIMCYMRAQANTMRDTLINDGFTEDFGLMLLEGWQYKKHLAEHITDPQISEYYDKALDAGAIGGKLLGAGGGGFLLFYCDEWNQQKVEDALGLRRVDFRFTKSGSKVIFSS